MYLAYDIGGTFIKYAVMNDEAKIIAKGKTPTIGKNNYQEFMDVLVGIYKRFDDIHGIALSTPGLVDENQIIYGGGAISCLDQKSLAKDLSKKCHHINVAIENDGKCAALAEAWKGSAKDKKSCYVFIFGTGIAGGFILNKKIYKGHQLVAGEISYLIESANRNPIELHCFGRENSTIKMIRKVESYLNREKNSVSGEEVYQLLKQGDKVIEEILEDFYFHIAIQCYNIQYICNPEIICLGGGISEEPLFIQGVQKYVDKIFEETNQFRKPAIKKCYFQNDANLIGALSNYFQKYIL